MTRTARRRLPVDERRAHLVEVGLRLFGGRPADDVAVEDIAREAGVSAGLLYHYFGSKKEYQLAVTAHAYERLQAATEPDASLPPGGRLVGSLATYVAYVRRDEGWWAWLLRGGGGGDPRFEELGARLREVAAARVLEGLPPEEVTATVELAVRGWVGFNSEVAVSWIEQRQAGRSELAEVEVVGLMVAGLLAVLQVAGVSRAFLDRTRAEADEALRA